jgi:hypothetical protein
MKKYLFSFFLLPIFCVLSLVATTTFAQFDPAGAGDIFSLSIYPTQPGPNQNIEVDAESFSINLDTIKMTWVVNGKVVAVGVGVKSINTITGPIGSKTSISVNATTPLGNVNKTISLQINSVNLSFEGVTSIPDFYKGLPLPSNQSSVRIVAFPDIMKGGVKVSDNSLVYTWKINGSIISDESGYGKNFFIYKFPIVSRPVTVEVSVSIPNQNNGAKASIVINPVSPKVLIYENNPVLGINYSAAVGQVFSLTNAESRFVALPYFFSARNRFDPSLNYAWSVGGSSVSGSSDDLSAIVVRPDKGASGNTTIAVNVTQSDNILQTANAFFNLIFGPVKSN